MKHKLKNIDAINKTGMCSVCGHVRIRKRSEKKKSSWRCVELQREYDYKRIRNDRKKLSHHFTIGNYEEMFKEQNGVCAICETQPDQGKRLSIDHDHDSGIVRGLLCSKCNLAIGLLNDDIKIIESSLTYLKKYSIVTKLKAV